MRLYCLFQLAVWCEASAFTVLVFSLCSRCYSWPQQAACLIHRAWNTYCTVPSQHQTAVRQNQPPDGGTVLEHISAIELDFQIVLHVKTHLKTHPAYHFEWNHNLQNVLNVLFKKNLIEVGSFSHLALWNLLLLFLTYHSAFVSCWLIRLLHVRTKTGP